MSDTETLDREKIAAYNAAFHEKIETAAGRAEIAAGALTYIRQRLREESFARKILVPTPVTKFDLQRALDHDTMQKICDIEYDADPNALAMPLNFTSQPKAVYVRQKRFAIDFFKIETPTYEKSEMELYAYEHPVLKVIEENSVKDIQYIEDKVFISHVDAIFDTAGSGFTALDATAGTANPYNAARAFTGAFDRTSVNGAFNTLMGAVANEPVRKLRAELVLCNEIVWSNWLDQDADVIGNAVAEKITVDGYTYNQILGRKLVTTTKVDLVPNSRFYVFAAQRFFGYFLVLNATKFWMDKRADMLSWRTWELIGMGFGNVRAVMRVGIGA